MGTDTLRFDPSPEPQRPQRGFESTIHSAFIMYDSLDKLKRTIRLRGDIGRYYEYYREKASKSLLTKSDDLEGRGGEGKKETW